MMPHCLTNDGKYSFIIWLTTTITQLTNLESTPNFWCVKLSLAYFVFLSQFHSNFTIAHIYNLYVYIYIYYYRPIAYELWTTVLFIWIPVDYAKEVIDMFAAWHDSFGRHRIIVFWKAMPHCILWRLWRERNTRSFEDVNSLSLKLKPTSFVSC